MKKKGVVYRATMFAGLFMIMVQVAGETNYSRFWKNIRNKELQDEKRLNEKIDQMEEEDSEEEEMGGNIDLNQQAFLEGIGAPEDNDDEMGLMVEEEEFYREDEEEAAASPPKSEKKAKKAKSEKKKKKKKKSDSD